MILDKGICTVFREYDTALSGEMPRLGYTVFWKSWYGELSFETRPARPTDGREELRTDARIRIQQNRDIRQRDIVVLKNVDTFGDADHSGVPVYRVTRAWHGQDDDSPALITDLNLEVYTP